MKLEEAYKLKTGEEILIEIQMHSDLMPLLGFQIKYKKINDKPRYFLEAKFKTLTSYHNIKCDTVMGEKSICIHDCFKKIPNI